jgi:hypothetical protein
VPEDDRRRQAVTILQIAECMCRYAASVLSSDTGPVEAEAEADPALDPKTPARPGGGLIV